MMRRNGIELSINCNTQEVLSKLRSNRAEHAKMVELAKAGYLKAAEKELSRRLSAIREGKVVPVSTHSLPTPSSFLEVYDTAIAMLTSHVDPVITLSADEYRRLMEDHWEWTQQFAVVNSEYSPETRAWGVSKGVDFGLVGFIG